MAGAFAGTQDGAKFTLHASTYKNKLQCTTNAPTIPCSQYNLTWAVGVDTNVYLVVANGDAVAGIAGASCGILYDNAFETGVDVFGWTLCADLEFTNGAATCLPDLPPCEWPISGGGNRVTWVSTTNCQRTVRAPDGVHAIAGCVLPGAYSPDVLQLTPNNEPGNS